MTVGVRDGERKEEIRAMSEENKALVRRYFEEIWDKGNLDLIDELFTTNFVRHGPTATEGEVRGQEGFEGLVSMYRSALPDLRIPIEDLIAEGDRVVTRWTARGTHREEFLGIPANGDQVSRRMKTKSETGFVFENANHRELVSALERARSVWRTPAMDAMRRRCMVLDRSWTRSAALYERLYLGLIDPLGTGP
jgi:steroid delta-isomerase-like uncharacterized protein